MTRTDAPAGAPSSTADRRLVASYVETDEGRAVLAALDSVEQPDTGLRSVSLGGLPGASVAFVLAAGLAGEHAPGEGDVPHLVVTGTQEEAEAIRDELEALSGEAALFFPPWESLFVETSTPDEDIFHERLSVMRALGMPGAEHSVPRWVVAPVHAIMQPIPPRDLLRNAVLRVEVDGELERDGLAKTLADAEFQSVPLVMRRGEFSVRGDIVDVYPFDALNPVRIEFFGDTIESIREYSSPTAATNA